MIAYGHIVKKFLSDPDPKDTVEVEAEVGYSEDSGTSVKAELEEERTLCDSVEMREWCGLFDAECPGWKNCLNSQMEEEL